MKKKRLFATLLAAAMITAGAFALAGCNDDGNESTGTEQGGGTGSGNGSSDGSTGSNKGLQVDSDKWSTEIKKFNIDESLSKLNSYTIKADLKDYYESQTLSTNLTIYVNRKDKEIYMPDNKNRQPEKDISYSVYLKLSDPFYVSGEERQMCEITRIENKLINNEVKISASKTTYGYDAELEEFNDLCLLNLFTNIKIGDEFISLSEAYQYFTFDETDGAYKATNLGFPLEYITANYVLCDVEIVIKQSSFNVGIKYSGNSESGETYDFDYNIEIYNFNNTQFTLPEEDKAELDKLN